MNSQVDNILGIISIIAFCGIFLSLIFAVIDVWYIEPIRRERRRKKAEEEIDKITQITRKILKNLE